jgi:hypothetical protein
VCNAERMSRRTRRTQVSRDQAVEPRLPHERDESSDAARPDETADTSTPLGRQAHDDVQRGLADTDRGPVLDRVYNEKVAPGARRRRAR